MSLGWVAIWIYRTVLTPIYPEIQASLDNVSNAEIGAIASFYFLLTAVCKSLAEYWSINSVKKIMLMAGFTLLLLVHSVSRKPMA